jgi:hypothetical protein
MTKDQMRGEIAKVIGWKQPEPATQTGLMMTDHNPMLRYPPNYPGDLNAISEACSILTDEQEESFKYYLEDAIGTHFTHKLIHATAEQRCEAFLKTLSLWTE